MAVTITTTSAEADLAGILALQRANLRLNLPTDVATEQGFVTLQYTLDQMRKMHQAGPSVIAKDGDTVVGYVITTLPETRQFVPELANLFSQIDTLTYHNRPLPTYTYYIAGQVCVADGYCGLQLLYRMHRHHRSLYNDSFQLLITDIFALNPPPLAFTNVSTFRFCSVSTSQRWAKRAYIWTYSHLESKSALTTSSK